MLIVQSISLYPRSMRTTASSPWQAFANLCSMSALCHERACRFLSGSSFNRPVRHGDVHDLEQLLFLDATFGLDREA